MYRGRGATTRKIIIFLLLLRKKRAWEGPILSVTMFRYDNNTTAAKSKNKKKKWKCWNRKGYQKLLLQLPFLVQVLPSLCLVITLDGMMDEVGGERLFGVSHPTLVERKKKDKPFDLFVLSGHWWYQQGIGRYSLLFLELSGVNPKIYWHTPGGVEGGNTHLSSLLPSIRRAWRVCRPDWETPPFRLETKQGRKDSISSFIFHLIQTAAIDVVYEFFFLFHLCPLEGDEWRLYWWMHSDGFPFLPEI